MSIHAYKAAIDASSPDDVIEIDSGYYTESVIYSHNVTLKGVDTGSGKPTLAGSIDTNGNPFSASYLIVTGPIIFVKDIIINGLYDTQILGGMNTR